MNTVRYVLALITVLALPPAVIWWYVVHPFVGFWRRVGARATMWVLSLGMTASMVGGWFVRGRLMGQDLGTSWWLTGLGVGFIGVSIYIGIRRRRYLTFHILSGMPELEPEKGEGKLLTEGPYAVIRHPRYMEVLIGSLGYVFIANYVGAYVVGALCMVLLHGVVLLEERELMERFGDAYRVYKGRVPRYIPAWFGSRTTSSTSQTGR